MSSSGSFGVEVAREGAETDAVWSGDAIGGTEHPIPTTPPPTAAAGRRRSRSRSATTGGPASTPCRSRRERNEADAFFVVRPATGPHVDPPRAVHGHVQRLQRLGRPLAVYRRHPGLVRAPARSRIPRQAGAGRAQGADRARSRGARVLRQGGAGGCRRGAAGRAGGPGSVPSSRGPSRRPSDRLRGPQDLEARPDVLDPYRLYLSVGHDEYWSWEMRDTVEGFVGRGGNAAFFSGNTAFWQVRMEDDAGVMVCWKDRAPTMDPWSARPRTPHERALVAPADRASRERADGRDLRPRRLRARRRRLARRIGRLHDPSAGALGVRAYRASLWRRARRGARRRRLRDRRLRAAPGRRPPRADARGRHAEVVRGAGDGAGTPLVCGRATVAIRERARGARARGAGPVRRGLARRTWRGSGSNHAVMGCFTHPGGGTVFNAGCTDWTYGIEGGDPIVQRVTRNVLERLST